MRRAALTNLLVPTANAFSSAGIVIEMMIVATAATNSTVPCKNVIVSTTSDAATVYASPTNGSVTANQTVKMAAMNG